MKRSCWRVALSFILVVVVAAGVRATCVPTYDELLLWEDSCDDWSLNTSRVILERYRSYITWPDHVSDSVDVDGHGLCSQFPEMTVLAGRLLRPPLLAKPVGSNW